MELSQFFATLQPPSVAQLAEWLRDAKAKAATLRADALRRKTGAVERVVAARRALQAAHSHQSVLQSCKLTPGLPWTRKSRL